MDKISVGDEVVLKQHRSDCNDYDILTVLRVKNGVAECFENNPGCAFMVKIEDLEPI